MYGRDIVFIGLMCLFIGVCAGLLIAYLFLEDKYRKRMDDAIEGSETKCLHTIRDNYAKEQNTRKLLLNELGEALDVDVVYLPSFGYVTLKRAFEIPEDII